MSSVIGCEQDFGGNKRYFLLYLVAAVSATGCTGESKQYLCQSLLSQQVSCWEWVISSVNEQYLVPLSNI